MNSFPYQLWRSISHRPRRWLSLMAGLVLVAILAMSQVSWSAPATISAAALNTRLNTEAAPLILDVRSPAEYAAGHIPGALNLPYRELPNHLATLAEFGDEDIVVYCEVGIRAGIAETVLEQAGFQQVLSLEGDMRGWRAAGLPISTEILENAPQIQ